MSTPLYDQILTQAGGRQPGQPVARPNSGGRSMQPSVPSYPSPPSSTVGAVGRPSSRPIVPVGVQAPTAPTAPVSSPAGPTSAGTPLTSNVVLGDSKSGGNPGGMTTFQHPPPQEPAQPAAPPPDPMKQQMRTGGGGAPTAALNLNRVPSRADYVGLLPGTGIGTPYGHATVGSDGNPIIQFASPQHEARYRADEIQYASKYGSNPLSQFPGAPTPNIRLGRPAFNPFSGSWLTPDVH